MAIDPKAGLVIRYDFLWKEEQIAGRGDGAKDRPCAIILVSKPREDGSKDVVLCPITHSSPKRGETAVEIPYKVSRHLRLDDDRSWIKTDQVNTVRGEKDRVPYGVTPVDRRGQWVFGTLPYELGKRAFEQVREKSHDRSLQTVRRDASDKTKDERRQ